MDKLLYRALIPKAPFSQRSSKFRQAIFCTIWSKPTFPTCLLAQFYCSTTAVASIDLSSAKFYATTRLSAGTNPKVFLFTLDETIICVSSLKFVIIIRCLYVWTYVSKHPSHVSLSLISYSRNFELFSTKLCVRINVWMAHLCRNF